MRKEKPVINPRDFTFVSGDLRVRYYNDALKASNIDLDKPVQVYRNLHNGMWSVRQGGIVRIHTNYICLSHAEFKVGEKGRQRVLREKKKNVHAYVKGFIIAPSQIDDGYCSDEDLPLVWSAIGYNPYYAGYFYEKENMVSVDKAEYVDMDSCDGHGENVVAAWAE
jgi:hypothetical protein